MRQETYRFAFEEANAELRDILEQFEHLRSRKEQIEKVVTALKPFLDMQLDELPPIAEHPMFSLMAEATASVMPEEMAHEVAETAPMAQMDEGIDEPITFSMEAEHEEAEDAFESEPEPVVSEMAADPFQRRIDDVLRHGVGGRELRIHSRSLNGLLSRV